MGANLNANGKGALAVVEEQLAEATGAKKCHACGCFHATVGALEHTEAGKGDLALALARARETFAPRKYECLGCEVCFPAIAENAFAEAFPGEAPAPHCPTGVPDERRGWPPLPGDYRVVRFGAPVAVCALNSSDVSEKLAARMPAGLALAGTLHTENLGIERIVRNVLANPHVRFLLVCGEDTRQAIGHLPGQSIAALCANGVDGDGRIRGALGKRPVLKNVTDEQVDAFRRQVELVSLAGVMDLERIEAALAACARRDPGLYDGAPVDTTVPVFPARQPSKLVLDPAGFLVVYPDASRGLVLEHYRNEGVLECVIEGPDAAAVGATAVERGVVSRLDHAVYLGRELARAEESLRTGRPYVQDRAPEPTEPEASPGCACAPKT